jgi:hypothetical protein
VTGNHPNSILNLAFFATRQKSLLGEFVEAAKDTLPSARIFPANWKGHP